MYVLRDKAADGLADYAVITAAHQVLTADRPVWEVLLIAGGAAVLMWSLARAASKEAKKARKAIGL